MQIACLFSYRARQKMLTRLKIHQSGCLTFIFIAFSCHNVAYCTQCHICCPNTTAVPVRSLKLLWKGLTSLSQTIVSLGVCKCLYVSEDFVETLAAWVISAPWSELTFCQSESASAASSELRLGTVRKVGQGQHMTEAHCYTTLKNNSLFLCFAISHFLSVSLSHNFSHIFINAHTQQPFDTFIF